jgi:hypothetical protein
VWPLFANPAYRQAGLLETLRPLRLKKITNPQKIEYRIFLPAAGREQRFLNDDQ